MSISAAVWCAAISPPASPPPQPLVPAAPTNAFSSADALVSAGLLLWLLVAAGVLRRWRVWRADSIVGPQRTGPGEMVWSQVFIFGYGLFGGAVTLILISRWWPQSKQAVGSLILGSVGELVAWGIVVGLSIRLRPSGLRKLGLSLGQAVRGVPIGLCAILVVFPLVALASELTVLYLHWTGRPQPEPHQVLQSLAAPHDRLAAVASVAAAVVAAPLFEELAFRGVLQTLLGRMFSWFWDETAATPRWLAVVLTAMAFAAVHGVPAFAPALFLLAVGLGYVYERTGNLWASITMHAAFNGIQIVLFLTVAHG